MLSFKEPLMRRYVAYSLGLLLIALSVRAADPVPRSADRGTTGESPSRTILDVWHAAYLEGGRAGFGHTSVNEVERDGMKVLETTTELSLTVKRFQKIVELRMKTGSVETPEGKVLGVSMTQYLGNQRTLLMTGTVKGKQLRIQVSGMAKSDKTIPWDDQVLGLYAQENLYKDRKVQAGDVFSYSTYEPVFASVITNQVAVKNKEEVDVLQVAERGAAKPAGHRIRDYEDIAVYRVKKRLLRCEAVPDKLETDKDSIQLPPLLAWLDDDLQVVRTQVEMPLLGTLVLYRTNKLVATQRVKQYVDIGLTSHIPLNKRIDLPYTKESAVYRVTVSKDINPETTFVQDERQQIKNIKGNTFELHVQASHERQAADSTAQVSDEFLKSCYFINSNDAKVRERTRQAVGTETDPWQKVVRIEKYVREHMDRHRINGALTTADDVARTMEGDCKNHSVLAAAMCRAAGVPSRTAVGLIYANDAQRGPVMAFHMWTEVWVKGQWLPFDATFGLDSVSATHLKITDVSWQDEQSLKPLLPVVKVLGKLSIQVIRTGDGD
jgi:hypothetical protein